jgi:hypothetical protein
VGGWAAGLLGGCWVAAEWAAGLLALHHDTPARSKQRPARLAVALGLRVAGGGCGGLTNVGPGEASSSMSLAVSAGLQGSEGSPAPAGSSPTAGLPDAVPAAGEHYDMRTARSTHAALPDAAVV